MKTPYENELSFLVREHHASTKHFDFRLECRGVYISFAVPKGPSMNPDEKRLAIEVKPHAVGSFFFEGKIAKGKEGAGPVMIWDRGFYYPVGLRDVKKEVQDYIIRDAYLDGRIRFVLNGSKLRGAFQLSKWDKDKWILQKVKDDYASKEDIKRFNRSVFSNLTMQEIKEGKNIKDYRRGMEQMGLF